MAIKEERAELTLAAAIRSLLFFLPPGLLDPAPGPPFRFLDALGEMDMPLRAEETALSTRDLTEDVASAMTTSVSPAAVRAAVERSFFFFIFNALWASDDSVMEATLIA